MRTSLTLCVAAALVLVLPSDPVRAQDLEAAKASVVRITSKVDGLQRTGTGFVVKVEPDLAYIVTASHVVEGDSAPQVEFLTRRNRPVTAGTPHIEGGNPGGLALLTVRGADNIPAGLKPLTFGSSASVQAGQEVSVIGFGQGAGDWAVIVARVASRQGRDLRLDGRIEEGNSGGPVLRDGRVVALVTSVKQGFGVSVPSLFVEAILEGWGIAVAAPPVAPRPEAPAPNVPAPTAPAPAATVPNSPTQQSRGRSTVLTSPIDLRSRGNVAGRGAPLPSVAVFIVNANSGLCLTIAGAGTAPNTEVVQFGCDRHRSRLWTLSVVSGTDIVQVKNDYTGLCLTLAGGGTANNLTAVQFGCDDHPSRRWRFASVDDRTFRLVNVNSGLCLTVAGGGTATNLAAVQFPCDGDRSRDWRFQASGRGGARSTW